MSRAFVNPLARGTAGVVDRARAIKQWTRDRLALPDEAVVSVNELACHLPGCLPKETVVLVMQDFDLLKPVIRAWVGVYLEKVDQGRIAPGRIDWLLCHYSAESLRQEIVGLLESTAGMIPREKWFSNLPTVGNVGSASIWVMLDEFMRSGRAKSGQKILCVVPESGRAFVGFMMLEVV